MDDQTIVGLWKAVLARSSDRQGVLLNLIVLGGFGFLVPWRWGYDFFSPPILISYTALAMLFAASTVTDLIRATAPRSPFVAAIGAATLHSVSVLLVIYALGVVAVNLAMQARRFVHPNWELAGAVVVFAAAGALFVASFGATLAVLFSPGVSRNAIRALFAGLLLGIFYGKPRLPAMWQVTIDRQLTTAGMTRSALVGAAVCGVLASGLMFAFRRRK